MGKQGPCYHCGVTSTPLWRNGPPEKPVLCNACGSRWRTKGTLTNYTPLHARADIDDFEDYKVSKMKSISVNRNKESKTLKRKLNQEDAAIVGTPIDYNQGFRKVVDEDTSNRSSSGSVISNSESCAQFGSADASDYTGQAQTNVWDTSVPSRKRTCVSRLKESSVEKLTKDLFAILQEQQASCFSGSLEEDLLYENESPMVSVEIGYGSVLMRHPSSIAREEESECSSLSVENKCSINEAYSSSSKRRVYNDTKRVDLSCQRIENDENVQMQAEQLKRNKSPYEKSHILRGSSSPLCNIDMNDIFNFEEFATHLTHEEQQQLMKFLPSVDTAKLPHSLLSMFDSPQFKENLCSFQQLLVERVFDVSYSDARTDDRKALKALALCNLTQSHWVESYQKLKECKTSSGESAVARVPNFTSSNNVIYAKRSRDHQNQNNLEMTRSPKRGTMKSMYDNELIDTDLSCFSPRTLFAFPPDGNLDMVDSVQFVAENSDQDLLLDVPFNTTFPQAELLYPAKY